MVKLDNPVRIARLGRRLSQKKLADEAGIARMTLVAIEEGTTRSPDHETLLALSRVLEQDVEELDAALRAWHRIQPQATYSTQALRDAAAGARTFVEFRERLEPSATRFASNIGVARATLTGYESGARRKGIPDTIVSGLIAVGAPISVVRELEALPPC